MGVGQTPDSPTYPMQVSPLHHLWENAARVGSFNYSLEGGGLDNLLSPLPHPTSPMLLKGRDIKAENPQAARHRRRTVFNLNLEKR